MKNTLKLIVLALGLTLGVSGALAQSEPADANPNAGPNLPERESRERVRSADGRQDRGPRRDDLSSETREVRPESRRDRISSDEPAGLRRERRRDREGNGRGGERGFERGAGQHRGVARADDLDARGLRERSGPPRERAELADRPGRNRRGFDDRLAARSADSPQRRVLRDEVDGRPLRRMERTDVGPRPGSPRGPRFEGRGGEQIFRREGGPGFRGPSRDEGRGSRRLMAQGRNDRMERGERGERGGGRGADWGERRPWGGRELAPRDEDRGPRGNERGNRDENRRGARRGDRS